jgi:hypothetical protein
MLGGILLSILWHRACSLYLKQEPRSIIPQERRLVMVLELEIQEQGAWKILRVHQDGASPSHEPSHVPTVEAISPDANLQAAITRRAYELYQDHGYANAAQLDVWHEAEGEVLSQLAAGGE